MPSGNITVFFRSDQSGTTQNFETYLQTAALLWDVGAETTFERARLDYSRLESLDQELGDRVRASRDFDEGIAAFREKRPPRYE